MRQCYENLQALTLSHGQRQNRDVGVDGPAELLGEGLEAVARCARLDQIPFAAGGKKFSAPESSVISPPSCSRKPIIGRWPGAARSMAIGASSKVIGPLVAASVRQGRPLASTSRRRFRRRWRNLAAKSSMATLSITVKSPNFLVMSPRLTAALWQASRFPGKTSGADRDGDNYDHHQRSPGWTLLGGKAIFAGPEIFGFFLELSLQRRADGAIRGKVRNLETTISESEVERLRLDIAAPGLLDQLVHDDPPIQTVRHGRLGHPRPRVTAQVVQCALLVSRSRRPPTASSVPDIRLISVMP